MGSFWQIVFAYSKFLWLPFKCLFHFMKNFQAFQTDTALWIFKVNNNFANYTYFYTLIKLISFCPSRVYMTKNKAICEDMGYISFLKWSDIIPYHTRHQCAVVRYIERSSWKFCNVCLSSPVANVQCTHTCVCVYNCACMWLVVACVIVCGILRTLTFTFLCFLSK